MITHNRYNKYNFREIVFYILVDLRKSYTVCFYATTKLQETDRFKSIFGFICSRHRSMSKGHNIERIRVPKKELKYFCERSRPPVRLL